MPTPCPERDRLERWREGSLPESEAAEIAAHVETCARCRAPSELGWLAHFRIIRPLGEGGMGMVFEAEDTRLQRAVALKVMLPEVARDVVARERFLREARAAAAIDNEHVVTIYHVDGAGDTPFLAMQLLKGETLQQRLAGGALLPLPEIIRIGREVADGLAAAHAAGLIHRDIKPSNLWLEAPRARVKILDFGLARRVEPRPDLSHAGRIVGTPSYMAPEQARGDALTPKADVYSLGCILHELCTGTRPSPQDGDAQPLREQRPDVPAALGSLVERMLARAPGERPAAETVALELGTLSSPTADVRPVQFFQGERQPFEQETTLLLRQRLRGTSFIFCLLLAFVFVESLFWSGATLWGLRLTVFLTSLASFIVLVRPRPLSARQLRWLEVVIFGGPLLQITAVPTAIIIDRAYAGDLAAPMAFRVFIMGMWSVMILVYGLYIPNTWQRAALILLPVALVPDVLMHVLAALHEPVRIAFEQFRFHAPIHLPVPVAVTAIYGVRIIRNLSLESFKARQLGQYRLKERLAGNGPGEVFAAEHDLLRRPCAVKLYHPGPELDEATLQSFQAALQVTADLRHWNVIEIIDYGRNQDGTLYFVTELLRGLDAGQLVARHGPLPSERAVFLLRQVCHALREAHHVGLLHRSLKPSNVFAAQIGRACDAVKVLDFGLVRASSGPAGTPIISASPWYLSPEQAKGAAADVRSDVYALGALGYFLVTGQPPFQAADPLEVVIAHLRDEVKPPRLHNAKVSAALEAIILRCLLKDPAARFANVDQVDDALAACVFARPWTERRASDWWASNG